MSLGVPVSELLLLAALIVVGGVVTGILAGLFGIGGGALIVPVLYEVFRVLGVPDEVRLPAMRRHLDRDHRSDQRAILSSPIATRVR